MIQQSSMFAPYLPIIRVETFVCGECGQERHHMAYSIPGFNKPFCHHCLDKVAHELRQDGREHAYDRAHNDARGGY